MGFIDSSSDPKLPVFYNVVHAVGKGCPNMRDDVKLVQYLLIAFYDKALASSSIYTKPNGDLKVTGNCDHATLNWIIKFQTDVNKRYPGTVLADNRVDRALNKNLTGSISQTIYTIALLNRFVLAINREAFIATPLVVSLENPLNLPLPSADAMKSAARFAPEYT